MFDLSLGSPVEIFLSILAFLVIISLVISVHEASHAYSANILGDPTARLMGRMTLNPIAHIDPLGTLILPLILIVLQAPVFGWAKPTPINPINFQNPRRDSAFVALAGPASNFAMAIAFSILFRIFPNPFLFTIVAINLVLGIFNLIPIPPLDGYKILIGVLPKEAALRLASLENFGPMFLILFLLVFFRVLSPIIFTVLQFFLVLFTGVSLF
jgi:Zn-dependent protease